MRLNQFLSMVALSLGTVFRKVLKACAAALMAFSVSFASHSGQVPMSLPVDGVVDFEGGPRGGACKFAVDVGFLDEQGRILELKWCVSWETSTVGLDHHLGYTVNHSDRAEGGY